MADTTLNTLLLPSTPDSVCERYLSLAERSREHDFGPLVEDIVVLDTETTGLSFRTCELIEIAAARMSEGRVAERFQTFVCPKQPIPPEISRLTGIRQVDVQQAPDAVEAVAQLADFVGGSPILAHNASFDRTFVEQVPGGSEVSPIWIDTLALSRMALPRLSSHRLADMAEAFGCASVTHRAMDDVDALCGIWPILLQGLSDLPAGLLAHLAGLHEEVPWPFRTVFSALADPTDGPFNLRDVRHDLVSELPVRPRPDIAERGGRVVAPAPDRIDHELSCAGAAGRMYPAYESRPEQQEMARSVAEALGSSTHRVIEAGTGVGKSMAYLLPAVLFARENDLTVGIATKTNALTDQLVSHELPALDAALPGGVSFASLKGYDHYLCLNRLQRTAAADLPVQLAPAHDRSDDAIAADMLTAIAVSYAFACQSPEGDLDALGIRWRYVPRSMLATTPAECQRHRCPFFPNECFLHGARRRAASADVVVTNHSLLLRNVTAGGKILPPIRHWIVDEAHSLESEARRQWAVEVSAEDARAGFEKLGGTKTGQIHVALTKTAALDGRQLHARLLTKASASIDRARLAHGQLMEALRELVPLAGPSSGYDGITLWVDETVRQSPEWAGVAEVGHACVERFEQANQDLREAADEIADAQASLGADLLEAGQFLSATADAIRLVVEGTDESYVYSAQLSRRKRDHRSDKLVAEKIDPGDDLARLWLPEMMSVTFTSATMTVAGSFAHFEHAVGLDREGAGRHENLRLDSSFDYDRNMAVIVCRDMPAPNNPNYLQALEDMLYDVHVAMNGSVLTLFTNRREMERVHQGLAPRLAVHGLELDVQGFGMTPRRLRERFLADTHRSLFALKSFWEGFDAVGDTLRCVVIPKLPFASPRDPLVRVREQREDRSWWRYSLPEAVLEVRQAAGRLIRSSTDSGVLILADSRVSTKRYGRQFVGSLPTGSGQEIGRSQVGRFIEIWRSSR